jgi:hypothetical protein
VTTGIHAEVGKESSGPAGGSPRRRILTWTPLLLVVGVLLAQTAWLLSVPAFRGPDEFDHAYRAAAVAGGDWISSGTAARDGRGELVPVPRGMVTAAGPECRALSYTGEDNCAPAGTIPDGRVLVASSASRYEPLYYWTVGQVTKQLDGTAALQGMRVVSALLVTALLGLAAWTVTRWARTPWPFLGLVLALTPVLLYSSIVVAPNALEIAAAYAVWVPLLGLVGRGVDVRTERTLLWSSLPGALVLLTVRPLGVGWTGLALVVLAWLCHAGSVRQLVRRHRGTVATWTATAAATAVAAVLWVLVQAPAQLEGNGNFSGAVGGSLLNAPVWVLQTIAAAPGRHDPAPGIVYLVGVLVLGWWLIAGFRVAPARMRVAMVLIAAGSIVGPLVVTMLTYREAGVIWQGRYSMPLCMAVVFLAGKARDEADGRVPRAGRLLKLGVGLYAIGQAVEVLSVASKQAHISPSVAAGLWTPPNLALVAGLMIAAWVVLGLALDRAMAESQ